MNIDEAKKFEYHFKAAQLAMTPPKRKKSPLSLPPLTLDEWDAMEGKARWDSIVALRGPDLVSSATLKWFTTSVIRHRLSQVMRVGGILNQKLPFVVLGGPTGGQSIAPFDLEHFRNHIHEAADWLKIPICWCSQDIWNLMITSRSNYEVLKKLRDVNTGDVKVAIEAIVGPLEEEAPHASESL